jgi:MoaA/NifB/PqqE/SkfB family radical SAM enzyme
MPNNKTFCILPFVHSCIHTNGDITLCCVSREKSEYNIKTSDIGQWWNSDYLKSIRQRLLDGEELAECTACYELEQQGFISQRQQRNLEYKIVQPKYADKIINYLGYDNLESPADIEIELTNLCNLKCIMCNETESSAILSENKKLKIAVHDQSDFSWDEATIDKIKNLFDVQKTKLINIRGGEPFMVPQIKDILLNSVMTGSSKNIKLHISTNCTKFDQEWVEILDQFKEIRMMCSLDAVDQLSEYIRYNSDWNEIKENIKLMRTIKNVNIIVNATIQNINLLGLDQLIAWCQKENLFLLFNILQNPRYLQIDVLPAELHNQALNLLVKAKQNLSNPELVNNLDNLIDVLRQIKSVHGSQYWNDFLKDIQLRESVRNNSILDVVPELKNYINAENS